MGLSHPSSRADGSCRTSNSCIIRCATPSWYFCTPSWPRALLAQFGIGHGRRLNLILRVPLVVCVPTPVGGGVEKVIL